nr:Nif3-like dinuclear metal center hexameric protein [Lactobacillus selangorensis]
MAAQTLIDRFEQFAPLALRMGNDPTGFQLGKRSAPIKRVLVTLDVRPEVVQEAIDKHVDFIFAHHPVLFHPIHKLDLADPQNQMYADLLAHHITVYAAHTNLDRAWGGMNDWLADALQLQHVQPFDVTEYEQLQQVTVETPEPETLTAALTTSNIKAAQSADQVIFTVPKLQMAHFMSQLQQLPHNQIGVMDIATHGRPIGIGRMGTPKQTMTVRQYADFVKQAFGVKGARLVTHTPEKQVESVAVVGGDGGQFFPAAVRQNIDLYITGDVYYHTAHDMLANGLSVVDPGHHIEQAIKQRLTPMLQEWSQQYGWDLDIFASTLNTDPFQFI